MGRCLRAAAVFGVMRHEALTHRGGDARQPRRHGRRRARGGRQTRRGRRRDHEEEHACGLTARRIPARRLTERRSLRLPRRADCAFPSRRGAREVWDNPPPGCGALWEVAQLGKCVQATPRQAAGGVVPETRRPRPGAPPHKKTQSGQRASLMAHPESDRDVIRLPVVG